MRFLYGDSVPFPPQYDFLAAKIVMRDGDGCTVFSQLVKTENVEKIDVRSCHPVPEAK